LLNLILNEKGLKDAYLMIMVRLIKLFCEVKRSKCV